MKVYVVTGKSESGDSYGPIVFKKDPTDDQLESLVKAWDYGEGDGPGSYGSYVHLEVSERELMEE